MSVDVSSAQAQLRELGERVSLVTDGTRRCGPVAGAMVREQLEAQRQATITDRFVAGVLGAWLEAHSRDGELVSAAVDRVAAGLRSESRQPFGLVFDLPGFYATVEAAAGVPLPEWCDEGDGIDEEVQR